MHVAQQYRVCAINLLSGNLYIMSYKQVNTIFFELVHFIVAILQSAQNNAIWQAYPYQVSRLAYSADLVLDLVYVVPSLCPSGLRCREACTVALLPHCQVFDVSGVAKMTSLYMEQKWIHWQTYDITTTSLERYLPSWARQSGTKGGRWQLVVTAWSTIVTESIMDWTIWTHACGE